MEKWFQHNLSQTKSSFGIGLECLTKFDFMSRLAKKIWFFVTKFSVNTISSERSHLEDLPNVNVHWTFTLGFENSKNCFLKLIQTPTYSCYTIRPDSALWLRLYDWYRESQSQGGVWARVVRVRINQRTKSGTWESLVFLIRKVSRSECRKV